MTDRPEVRVGQVWALVDQRNRARVVEVLREYFRIQYIDQRGSYTGNGERYFSAYRDGKFWPAEHVPAEKALVSIVYDPTDAS